jgi:hypothetical protein
MPLGLHVPVVGANAQGCLQISRLNFCGWYDLGIQIIEPFSDSS